MKNLSIVQKTYDFIKYIFPIVNKLPRNQKFLLGDRIQNNLLNLLELFITAGFSTTPDKIPLLKQANLKLEILRYLIRLCYDLKYVDVSRYEFISKQINEIGTECGAWIKSVKN